MFSKIIQNEAQKEAVTIQKLFLNKNQVYKETL